MGVTVHDNEKKWFVTGGRRTRGRERQGERQRYSVPPAAQRSSSENEERRIDLNDGNAYTKSEFRSEYGGYREWDMSPPAQGGRSRDDSSSSDDWRQRRRERDVRRMANRSKPYTRASECTATLSEAECKEIDDLVALRLRKKLDRRFDEADALLSDLGAKGVSVSDDARSWRADGLSFVYEYRCDGGAQGRTDREVSEVEQLIKKRGVAKSLSQFEESDRLAESLYDLGVEVDDQSRKWWFVYAKGGGGGGGGAARGGDGRSGGQRSPSSKHDYARAESDDFELRVDQMDKIDALLGRRLAAKKAHDFVAADRLQAELREEGVEVDDKRRVWYVRYHDGGRAASSFNVRGW